MVNDFYRRIFSIEKPFEYQLNIWDMIQSGKTPILLKAPTGSGKTEAVLAPFLKQLIDNSFKIAPRLIYVLPMRVLINSIADRIENYSKKISSAISVKVQHGDLPNTPFFLSDIVVTTLDQFLYGYARSSRQVGRHIDIPAGSIASSIVVFDEAHMYRDEFTFSIMRALIEILNASHIPFVVMTATMPKSLEESIFENIPTIQKIFIGAMQDAKIDFKIEKDCLYQNNEVHISNKLLQKIKSKKTLIVVNQVKRAQLIYKEIKSRLGINDDEIILLHSRFTRADRLSNEGKAIELIPHKIDNRIVIPEGTGIVVSTQVLEAGIDFSAQLLMTELAPADSIIQRAGRLARYPGEIGEMIIFPVEDPKPYEEKVLHTTMNWLQKNPGFNIRDYEKVEYFIDQTLNYQANDFEASDTLIDLYECVLYADDKPGNIQLRNGKPITLVVVDIDQGKGKKKNDKIKDAIRKTNIRENSIHLDIRSGWELWNNKTLKYELDFDIKNNRWDFKEIQDFLPFKYYILEKHNYNSLLGVYPDASTFI